MLELADVETAAEETPNGMGESLTRQHVTTRVVRNASGSYLNSFRNLLTLLPWRTPTEE